MTECGVSCDSSSSSLVETGKNDKDEQAKSVSTHPKTTTNTVVATQSAVQTKTKRTKQESSSSTQSSTKSKKPSDPPPDEYGNGATDQTTQEIGGQVPSREEASQLKDATADLVRLKKLQENIKNAKTTKEASAIAAKAEAGTKAEKYLESDEFRKTVTQLGVLNPHPDADGSSEGKDGPPTGPSSLADFVMGGEITEFECVFTV